jgi:hypothetical protein
MAALPTAVDTDLGTASGVVVHEMGPAGHDQNGMVAIDGDLHDRMEF